MFGSRRRQRRDLPAGWQDRGDPQFLGVRPLSAFAVQGLAKDGQLATREQLAPLAKTNVESLAEFGYFTFAKNAGAKIDFGPPKDYSLEERLDKLVQLSFTVPLKDPIVPGLLFASVCSYDLIFFVDFSLAKTNSVGLRGDPRAVPSGSLAPIRSMCRMPNNCRKPSINTSTWRRTSA